MSSFDQSWGRGRAAGGSGAPRPSKIIRAIVRTFAMRPSQAVQESARRKPTRQKNVALRASSEHRATVRDSAVMSFYPAVVVAVDSNAATVQIEATGKQIVLAHTAYNAVPIESRQVGAKGYISFPKAPPVFTPEAHSAMSEVAA